MFKKYTTVSALTGVRFYGFVVFWFGFGFQIYDDSIRMFWWFEL